MVVRSNFREREREGGVVGCLREIGMKCWPKKRKNPHKGEEEKIEIGSDCIERAGGGVKGRKINGGYSKNI